MNITELKKIPLSTEIMAADQICATFTHKDGSQDQGFINLSGKMNVGISTSGNAFATLDVGSDNSIIISGSVAFGEKNMIGQYGYRVVGYKEIKNSRNTLLCIDLSVDSDIKEDVLELKPLYSIDASNSYVNCGRVLSVDFEHRIITVDSQTPVNTSTGYPFLNKSIFFIDHPTIGNESTIIGECSFGTGYKNLVAGAYAHAEGGFNTAANNYSHVEGKRNVAAWAAHAEGANNEALGETSHTEGRYNRSVAAYSHTQNGGNVATSRLATAEGFMSYATNARSFVWNGQILSGYQGDPTKTHNADMRWSIPDSALPENDVEGRTMEYVKSDYFKNSAYKSNGDGTFNVNPNNGISGFYIGNRSLADYLGDCSKRMKPLSGKHYYNNSEISSILKDIVVALGGELN